MERRRGHYLARIGVLLAVLAGGRWMFVAVGDSWFQLILAALMGVISTQLGFLGHQGGHRQVFRTRRANDLLGLAAGNVFVGLSFSWWVDKHNRHHAHPNHVDHDPDIGDGVLAFTIRQVKSRTGRFGRAVVRNQAWLFFPLLTLEGLNLRVASFRWLLSGSPA